MKFTCLSLRTTISSIVVTLIFLLTLLLIHQTVLPVLGWLVPALTPAFYDVAVYGAYPTTKYITFELESPAVNTVARDESCDNGLILLSPFGPSVSDMGPMILDARGNLVWMATGFRVVMNVKVQFYQSEPYITFWAGVKVGGIGQGNYYMLNSSYDVVHVVKAATSDVESRLGDLHEFIITNEGTALLTVYNTTQFDLSAIGRPKGGWIVDSLFQEVDIATGKLLFEWRASDYLDPAKSRYLNPFGGYKESNPYDFFHINSVQKDAKGNYLISSRHYHSIIYLSSTGEILWTLGGQYNDFLDLSNGKATSFRWQHDARWVDEDEGVISVFDNGSAGPIMRDASRSEALIIQINTSERTARRLHSYTSKGNALSASQGSIQVLANDHVFVGWGSSAAYSEFDLNTEVLLCETHVTPAALFWWERVKTYRAIKTVDWKGRPEYPPSTKSVDGKVYVSWNGATEVSAWQLEGLNTGMQEDEWQVVDIKEKTGFEDNFVLSNNEDYTIYRVAALNGRGDLLIYSEATKVEASKPSRFMSVLIGICAIVGLGVGVGIFLRRQRGLNVHWLRTASIPWSRYRYRKVPSLEMN